MRKIKVWIISVSLLLSLLLTGCGGSAKNYLHTDAGLKNEAEKALEEKYGEEFVIHEVWTKNQTIFYATCSPEDNDEIDFRAEIYKDGRGVHVDSYIQGIVANQINNNLSEDFQTIFDNCYTRAEIYNYYDTPTYENPEDVTIEDYLSQIDIEFIGYDVYICETKPTEESIQREYDIFNNDIQEKIKEGIIPNVVIDLYFVDEKMLIMSKEYYKNYEISGSDFEDALEMYPTMYIVYPNNKINLTYEEYKEQRMEIK